MYFRRFYSDPAQTRPRRRACFLLLFASACSRVRVASKMREASADKLRPASLPASRKRRRGKREREGEARETHRRPRPRFLPRHRRPAWHLSQFESGARPTRTRSEQGNTGQGPTTRRSDGGQTDHCARARLLSRRPRFPLCQAVDQSVRPRRPACAEERRWCNS